ncbi:ATP-dependent DNA ligase [Tundrisphaera lichenicola]|uniref:ATP-dependent DNA ligase n=1 Tax=Tundrisphaera lichenicola TaxID=2029860 RepID=UPI003EB6C79E
MKDFAELYADLDETTRTGEKVEALTAYFARARPADAAWAVYFLIGRKPKQAVPSKKLREWAAEAAGVPDWLFGESYDAVGDVAETVALLLPTAGRSSDLPLSFWVAKLLTLRDSDEPAQKAAMLEAWGSMDRTQRFVWNKLISGGFRVGVSQQLVTRALAKASGVEAAVIAHRLMGDWEPDPAFYDRLRRTDARDADHSRPYPFCLAHALEGSPEGLGPVEDWLAEWKWDGIRCQLIRREGDTFLWTRGEELVTDRYPELATLGAFLPDGTVLDGEILPYRDGAPLPFAQLQRRIGRKTLGKAILAEVPVVLVAYDLIEHQGRDLRTEPFERRREELSALVGSINLPGRLILSPSVAAGSWEDLAEARQESRDRQAEGLMLKRLGSPYHVGRKRGDWWKWKVSPLTVDAVLTAAQRGSGKRASLYTDYTFSVWDDSGKLVSFAKAYSGLTDAEIAKVDAFVRCNMVEKFGPVRTVKPELVFELAFEGIQRSTRHKSGIAVRFPRILRWRVDKKAEEADTLETIRALLPLDP